jgi:hypothetical protein
MKMKFAISIILWFGILYGIIYTTILAAPPRTIDQKYQRLINEIKSRMNNRERWAGSDSIGIGTHGNPYYNEAGFQSIRSFLLARDTEYRTLDELLKIGTE